MKLPSFFSSGMVIGKVANIWGWTTPGRYIVAVFNDKKIETASDDTGLFQFTINSNEYGGPYTLAIGDLTLTGIYVGRVWLCGGQSNMEERINREKFPDIQNEPLIRVFQVEKGLDFDAPRDDVRGKWNLVQADFLNHVYAVPYFFGKKLRRSLADGVMMGLICMPAAGTPIEGWLPEEILAEKFPIYFSDLSRVRKFGFVKKSEEDAEIAKHFWLTELNENDTGLNEKWFERDYDDADWESRALLDNTNYPDYGAVWLRKRFILAHKPPKGTAVLHFGRVENSVTVYVNGVEVTHINNMYPLCTCVLPDVLIAGENTIVVRVVGETKRPNIVPGKDYFLQCADLRINLNTLGEKWKYQTGTEMTVCPPGVWFYGYPCGVYNYMLAPMLGLAVDGLLWYQGESNVKKPSEYAPLFRAFVGMLRRKFTNTAGPGKPLPIIFTQLANYVDPNTLVEIAFGEKAPGRQWAEMREQQRQCLAIPATAMAIAIDCGEYNDLHPYDKRTVGERLAMHARRLVYGEDIVTDGPIFKKAIHQKGKLTIHFENAQNLWAKNGHPLLDVFDRSGGMARIFAAIEGETLVLNIGDIVPTKIRFGWTDCPAVTLYNAYGLPASPFEADI